MFLSGRSKYVADTFILSTQACRPFVQQTTSKSCRCPYSALSLVSGHRFSQIRLLYTTNQLSRRQETIMNVFDRQAKRKQKNKTAILSDYNVYEYLREEVGFQSVLHRLRTFQFLPPAYVVRRGVKFSLCPPFRGDGVP